MALDAINVLIRSDPSVANQVLEHQKEAQDVRSEDDRSAKAKQKLDQRVKERNDQVKGGEVQKDVVSRTDDSKQKFQQIMGGAAGPEAADAAHRWENNSSLQNKLNEAQKEMFRKAMAENPHKAARAANALDNLTNLAQQPGVDKQVGDPRQQAPAQKTVDQKFTGQQTASERTLDQKATGQKTPEGLPKQPTFDRAINDSRLAGTLQKALLDKPELGKPAGELLANRFMQSPKADHETKRQFLDFGLRTAAKGQLDVAKKAGDLLGTLNKANIGRAGQQATMKAVERNAGKIETLAKGMDQLVSDPHIGKMPTFARTKAVELQAKANGDQQVGEGFQQLAAQPKFKQQSADNKGRFFSTIGTGRPSEYRQINDKLLTSLQAGEFPKRAGQVQSFLHKVSQQVQKDGAQGVDTQAAMRAAKQPPTPKLTLVKMDPETMSDEEMLRAQSKNRASIIRHFSVLSRQGDKAEREMNLAKYLEDVKKLPGLQMPEDPDLSALTPEEQQFYMERKEATKKRFQELRGDRPRIGPDGKEDKEFRSMKKLGRLLGNKRRPGGRKGELQARVRGRQPRYFTPKTSTRGAAASQPYAQATGTEGAPQGLPQSGARAQFGQRSASAAAQHAGDPIQQQVARALSGLGNGPVTADKAGMVAQAIAQQVAQQVAKQVMRHLSGAAAAGEAFDVPEDAAHLPSPQTQVRKAQQGKVDGWGIPRSFERDLGGADRVAVKAPTNQEMATEDAAAEKYTGRRLIVDPSSVRSRGDLMDSRWKDLSRPEMALLKNLGWNQQMWDTKMTPAARWPGAEVTAYVNLTPLQREAVRKLGFTAADWDTKVQAMASGRNA